MKNDIADILFKYTTGEATLEETNDALKEAEAGFNLEPGRNEITPDEMALTTVGDRQHPLPGQWPSSIIHEREGKGKEQQNVQHRRPQDRDRRDRHRTAERGGAAAGGGQPPRPVPGTAGDGAAIL